MSAQKPASIQFDQDDANLFQVDDARLRADAIKHSILPRLNVALGQAISLVREIYGIDVFEDSIVSMFPNFRTKRQNELKHLYSSAFIGLGGQRKAKWPGFQRRDGKPAKILPFRYAIELDDSGLSLYLENGWLKGLSDDSFASILKFHIANESKIAPLCFLSNMSPAICNSQAVPLLSPLKDEYEYRIKHSLFDNSFRGYNYAYPIDKVQVEEIVGSYAYFYPLYDSYLQIAKGEKPRLDMLIGKLESWLERLFETSAEDSPHDTAATVDKTKALQLAEQKVRVMPALRWQVFNRDNWKCVACGRDSHADAILQVDHIQPRSLGGSDSLENLQTLCDTCNLGKSNRDSSDLRG